jgi:hypothetical protein
MLQTLQAAVVIRENSHSLSTSLADWPDLIDSQCFSILVNRRYYLNNHFFSLSWPTEPGFGKSGSFSILCVPAITSQNLNFSQCFGVPGYRAKVSPFPDVCHLPAWPVNISLFLNISVPPPEPAPMFRCGTAKIRAASGTLSRLVSLLEPSTCNPTLATTRGYE